MSARPCPECNRAITTQLGQTFGHTEACRYEDSIILARRAAREAKRAKWHAARNKPKSA